jgi:hypothetical protein
LTFLSSLLLPHAGSLLGEQSLLMLPEPQHNQSGQCYCGCFLADILLCLSLLPPAGSLLGEQSLLMLPEPQHKYLRNLIMPAFTNEAIERLVPRMEAVLARYLDTWASAGAPVKAHNELRHMTFEFIVAVGAAAHAWLPSASVVSAAFVVTSHPCCFTTQCHVVWLHLHILRPVGSVTGWPWI